MHPLSYLLDILHEEFIKECTATPTAWLFHKAIRTDRKRSILEKPEKFEDDHYNDNHSNYVKDVSVHAGDS